MLSFTQQVRDITDMDNDYTLGGVGIHMYLSDFKTLSIWLSSSGIVVT